ncbi:MAG TPA: Gfo/Idh/MocA family oxidoreductase [Galbitalea sp.]
MSRPLGWGILGTGGIAHEFATDLQLTGHTVSAVGSRSQAGADAFASRLGIAHAHASYESLVQDPTVDIVYVATPHSLHAGNAILALEAGKHVLVEKPFTINAREARTVAELAAKRGLIVMEAMWTRFLPHMVRIREIVSAGKIGDVRAIIAAHEHRQTSDLTHRVHDPALGGGALLEVGIYPVSFAWDILGRPAAVRAIGSMGATGVDGQTAILLGYPDGQQAILHASAESVGGSTATILGTEGRIEIDATWFTPASFTVFDNAREVVERFDEDVVGRGLHLQATALERAIAGGLVDVPEMPIGESVAIMTTLDEIRADIGLRYPSD